MGWSGHLILGVVGIFFLAQLKIICNLPVPEFLWILIPGVAILFPPIVLLIHKRFDP